MKSTIEITVYNKVSDTELSVEIEGTINRGDYIDYPQGDTSYRRDLTDCVEEIFWDKAQYTNAENEAIEQFIASNSIQLESKLLAA